MGGVHWEGNLSHGKSCMSDVPVEVVEKCKLSKAEKTFIELSLGQYMERYGYLSHSRFHKLAKILFTPDKNLSDIHLPVANLISRE